MPTACFPEGPSPPFTFCFLEKEAEIGGRVLTVLILTKKNSKFQGLFKVLRVIERHTVKPV